MGKLLEGESIYDDIRSYRDSDMVPILKQMIRARIQLRLIRMFFYKKMRIVPGLIVDRFFRNWLKKELKQIKCTEDFFSRATDVDFDRLVGESSTEFTVSGIEKIEKGVGYFFISNHRDIFLDSILLNSTLNNNNIPTCHCAFGDNLVINKFVENFLRLNKGFIVKRNLPMREQFISSKHLSSYINFLLVNNESIWIAQSDGRSKDGSDITKPTVLKMLSFSKRVKRASFYNMMKNYKIIPVSVSYEFDPCDAGKAKELHYKHSDKEYQKKRYEDLSSIIKGIKGWKGKIHMSIGAKVNITEDDNENTISEKIDLEIHKNYKLWPNNYLAHDLLNNQTKFKDYYTNKDREKFQLRLDLVLEDERSFLLLQYANPVANQIREGVLK